MTDQEHADKIRELASKLNMAIGDALSVGLRVDARIEYHHRMVGDVYEKPWVKVQTLRELK